MTHKNKCSVQVSAIFLLELLVMLISKLHIRGPECCLFVGGGYLWFECLHSLVNPAGCLDPIDTSMQISYSSCFLIKSAKHVLRTAISLSVERHQHQPLQDLLASGADCQVRTAHYRKPLEDCFDPRCLTSAVRCGNLSGGG